jgi:hypothetical protein
MHVLLPMHALASGARVAPCDGAGGDREPPLYPEGRGCRRPTARKVIDLFEDVQRHDLILSDQPPVIFTTELTRLQRKVPRLLGMSTAYNC